MSEIGNKDVITREVIKFILGYVKPKIGKYVRDKVEEGKQEGRVKFSEFTEKFGDESRYITVDSLVEALNEKSNIDHTHTTSTLFSSTNDYFLTTLWGVDSSTYVEVLSSLCLRNSVNVIYFLYTGTTIDGILKNGCIYKYTDSPFSLEKLSYTKQDIDLLQGYKIEVEGETLQECLNSEMLNLTEPGTWILDCKWNGGSERKSFIFQINVEGNTVGQSLVDLCVSPIEIWDRVWWNDMWTEWEEREEVYCEKSYVDENFVKNEVLDGYCKQVEFISDIEVVGRVYQYVGNTYSVDDKIYRKGYFYYKNSEDEIIELKREGDEGNYVKEFIYGSIEGVDIEEIGCYSILVENSSWILYVDRENGIIRQTFTSGGRLKSRIKVGNEWGEMVESELVTVSNIEDEIDEVDYFKLRAGEFENAEEYADVSFYLLNGVNLEYSVDEGVTWEEVEGNTKVKLYSEDRVWLRGDNQYMSFSGDVGTCSRIIIGKSNIRGNYDNIVTGEGSIVTLLDKRGERQYINEYCCFAYLFSGSLGLTHFTATLPLGVSDGCFFGTFSSTGLKQVINLPYNILPAQCCRYMYTDCKNLETAIIPSVEYYTKYCMYGMYKDCINITEVEGRIDKPLAESCFHSIFQGCTSLTTIPVLEPLTLELGCYDEMFKNCSSLRRVEVRFEDFGYGEERLPYTFEWLSGTPQMGIMTFICPSILQEATSRIENGSDSKIPTGWKVENNDL